jgi:c(7)-type cytochrome triheme protein
MKRKMMFLFVIAFFVAVLTIPVKLAASDEEHGGDIIYTVPLKAVLFSHEKHVEDFGMDCDTCHDDIFEMVPSTGEKNKDRALFDGKYCMKALNEGKYCGSCHDGSTAFSADSQCARCHIGVKGYNRLREEVTDEDGH